MPANLPPQYYEAEKNFRSAKSPAEKIVALEEMLAIMPKHKGTDHLRAELRTRIAKLTQLAAKKSGAQRTSMTIEREGAAQIAIVGPTNVGKSQLVGSITNASPTVADYPFATRIATPGMMEFENIKVQLIDTPALAPQSIEWWLPPLLRRADALLVMVDLGDDPLSQMAASIEQLEKMRISLVEKKTEEEALPFSHKKSLVVGNKMDMDIIGENFQALQNKYGKELPVVAISARDKQGLEELKLKIYQALNIIRVYTKVPGHKPDLHDPIILERGSNLEQGAAAVHKDFAARLKYARIWGSGKHDGIMAKRDHILQDGDIIELHL